MGETGVLPRPPKLKSVMRVALGANCSLVVGRVLRESQAGP